uniref:Uncharacterized protein n=1 Tax=Eutreptiella gymnastica TaxID=73025 RepID=A0A7S4CBM1_9EUGL
MVPSEAAGKRGSDHHVTHHHFWTPKSLGPEASPRLDGCMPRQKLTLPLPACGRDSTICEASQTSLHTRWFGLTLPRPMEMWRVHALGQGW